MIKLETTHRRDSIFIDSYVSEKEINTILEKNSEKLDEMQKELYSLIDDKKIHVLVTFYKVKNIYEHAQAIANLIADDKTRTFRSYRLLKEISSKIKRETKIRGMKIEMNGRQGRYTRSRKEAWGSLKLNTKDSIIDVGKVEVIEENGSTSIIVLLCKTVKKIQSQKKFLNK
jgi:ribosomal protein S3